jgi:NAD(P)-dependent dehydrogenase (short-subunit alcohol dehydrogenase family)
MTDDLEGKVAIVAGGGGPGIGGTTSRLLAERGAAVVVADVALEAAEDIANQITAAGGRAVPVETDISDEEQVERMVATAVEHFGGVDVLYNNAAAHDVEADPPVTEMVVRDFDRMFQVNVRGFALGAKHTIPVMIERGGGVIVNTSSGAGVQGDITRTAYGSSKAALFGLTKYIATQYGRFGIRCIAIAPGVIATPGVDMALTPEMKEIFASNHLTGYIGRPEDVAEVVAFLVSDRARFITGTTIEVDGGFLAHSPVYREMLTLMEQMGIA